MKMRIRITIDEALAGYIRAQSTMIYGADKETIIALVRRGILEDCKNDNLLALMMPHLPLSIQEDWKRRRAIDAEDAAK